VMSGANGAGCVWYSNIAINCAYQTSAAGASSACARTHILTLAPLARARSEHCTVAIGPCRWSTCCKLIILSYVCAPPRPKSRRSCRNPCLPATSPRAEVRYPTQSCRTSGSAPERGAAGVAGSRLAWRQAHGAHALAAQP
jgi:hypothetical protein